MPTEHGTVLEALEDLLPLILGDVAVDGADEVIIGPQLPR